MSADFWQSTQHRYWLFTKRQLNAMRTKLEEENIDLVRMFPLSQPRHLAIFFNQQLIRLGKRLTLRQQAMATAQVYLKRFYSRVEMRRTNPYLVITTAIYLACKVEESPQHIRLIVQEARQLWQDFIGLDTSRIGECEFFLISELNSQLIVHQPYRTLTALRSELALVDEDVNLAKSTINDHYMTDLPLLFPPHVIALVAILLALVLRPNSVTPGQPGSGAAAVAGLAAAQAALSQAHGGGSGGGGGGVSSTAPGAGLAGGGSAGLPPAPVQQQQQQQQMSAAVSGAEARERQQEVRFTRVQRFAAWLAESTVDIASMVEATQEMISFYECYEKYNDKLTRDQINRFVKAGNLDR